MARFEIADVEKLGRLQQSLEKMSDDLKNKAGDSALSTGGKLLAEYFKGAIIDEGLVDTGELVDSIKAAAPSNSGGKHVDVYPHGTRKDGKRNAEVGAYMEYGAPDRVPPKKSTPATHWMSNTVDEVEEEILDVIEASILEVMDEHF